jgi:D-glycero-D-manno-heptose 1,7-bisphosphate phosphatase
VKLCIFDVDGTLVSTKSGAAFRKSADDWQWLPGRLEKVKSLIAQGIGVAIATNQGGVAFGYMNATDIIEELMKMCREAGIADRDVHICFDHPKASIEKYKFDSINRKPGPGMLLDAMHNFAVSPEETLYVGDRKEDNDAANAAQCRFMLADKYFAQ